jgi:hypothetical protein
MRYLVGTKCEYLEDDAEGDVVQVWNKGDRLRIVDCSLTNSEGFLKFFNETKNLVGVRAIEWEGNPTFKVLDSVLKNVKLSSGSVIAITEALLVRWAEIYLSCDRSAGGDIHSAFGEVVGLPRYAAKELAYRIALDDVSYFQATVKSSRPVTLGKLVKEYGEAYTAYLTIVDTEVDKGGIELVIGATVALGDVPLQKGDTIEVGPGHDLWIVENSAIGELLEGHIQCIDPDDGQRGLIRVADIEKVIRKEAVYGLIK